MERSRRKLSVGMVILKGILKRIRFTFLPLTGFGQPKIGVGLVVTVQVHYTVMSQTKSSDYFVN